MDRQRADAGSQRFPASLDEMTSVIGHAARVGPMRDYCTGLLLSGERKSVESIAAATAPAEASAQHQSLLHCIALGPRVRCACGASASRRVPGTARIIGRSEPTLAPHPLRCPGI